MSNWRLHGLVWLGLWTLAACGSGTFSSDFSQEIEQDCNQTIACTKTGKVESCIFKTGTALDKASPAQQQAFLDTVTRCEANSSCFYTSCTVTAPAASSYSSIHHVQIMFDCEQQANCTNSRGPTTATKTTTQCMSDMGSMLDTNQQAQRSFDTAFSACGGRTSCDWVACRTTATAVR
jgi:hypothetical protein